MILNTEARLWHYEIKILRMKKKIARLGGLTGGGTREDEELLARDLIRLRFSTVSFVFPANSPALVSAPIDQSSLHVDYFYYKYLYAKWQNFKTISIAWQPRCRQR